MKKKELSLFPLATVALAFNFAMKVLKSPLRFTGDGSFGTDGELSTVDYCILSFWCAVCRLISSDDGSDIENVDMRGRIAPVRVLTMHPNKIWGLRARLALKHVLEFFQTGDSSKIKGVITDLFEAVKNPITVGGNNISALHYLELQLYTIGEQIFRIAFLLSVRMKTWIGVDADGSNSKFVNSKIIKRCCRLIMHWTIDRYISFVKHYEEDSPIVQRILLRLEATKKGVFKEDDRTRQNSYPTREEFIADLRELRKLVAETSRERKKFDRMIQRVTVLGFAIFEFQGRINSKSVWKTLEEIAVENGISTTNRKAILSGIAKKKKSSSLNLGVKDEIALWILDVLYGYSIIQDRMGTMTEMVLANCQYASDIEAARLLLEIAGVKLEVIPLMEDPIGLSEKNVREICKVSGKVVMFGFSDGSKTNGFVPGSTLLMRACEIAKEMGKILFYGRAFQGCRGGGKLDIFLRAHGNDPNYYELFQGDDALFGCATARKALESLRPRVKLDRKRQAMPKVLLTMSNKAKKPFFDFVNLKNFTRMWRELSSLIKSIVISARPHSRSKDGASTKGTDWDSSRAIGVVQTCLAVLGYYVHLFGSGKVLEEFEEELTALYKAKNPHTVFLIESLRGLVSDVLIDHFGEVATPFLGKDKVEEAASDFYTLRRMIRSISDTPTWKVHDPLPIVLGAYAKIAQGIKRRRGRNGTMMKAMMHFILSYRGTSG